VDKGPNKSIDRLLVLKIPHHPESFSCPAIVEGARTEVLEFDVEIVVADDYVRLAVALAQFETSVSS